MNLSWRHYCLISLVIFVRPVQAQVYFSETQVNQLLAPGKALVELNVRVDKPLLKEIKKRTSARLNTRQLKIWAVSQGKTQTGWIFHHEVLGKHENIRYALAIDTHGRIMGMEIMEYRETHGGEVRDNAWRAQFYSMSFGERFHLGKDIDNISGATLSCRHLADGVHGLLILHDRLLRIRTG